MLSVFLLFFGLIVASAVCSLAEASTLSLPVTRAKILVEQKKPNAKALLYIKENISLTVSCIVILNNAINIIGSVYIGQMVAVKFGDQWLGAASALLTFSIIVAGEIIPKTLGERYKTSFALLFANPLKILIFLFTPVVGFIMFITKPFTGNQKMQRVTEEEIKMMLKLGRAEGTVEMDEELLCNRVFKLNDVRAAQIMKPLEQIYSLPADTTLEELKEKIINCPYSRIAVYDKDPLDIVGAVQHRVLLREIAKDNYKACVREFMTQPIFVNWFIKADALLEKFQSTNQHLFIVQDSHHRDVGLVTMEDVLEELFGEIYDEKDAAKAAFLKMQNHPANQNKIPSAKQ